MIIVGAGMSGLLCGALNPNHTIYESGPERESDHKALFRCKTDLIGKMLGIDFKKVNVYKGIWYNDEEVSPSLKMSHLYSKKVTGTITERSINNIESGTRYIPPEDFIDQLKKRCNIKYGTEFDFEKNKKKKKEPIVSTVPMPYMINLIGKNNLNIAFDKKPIYVNRIKISNCNSYCTMYYPDSALGIYRASIAKNILIIESIKHINYHELIIVFQSLGIQYESSYWENLSEHTQINGKINKINSYFRRNIITRLTLDHNIYSLGRYATWRSKVVLDDVLNDIFVIKKLINKGNYELLKYNQGEK